MYDNVSGKCLAVAIVSLLLPAVGREALDRPSTSETNGAGLAVHAHGSPLVHVEYLATLRGGDQALLGRPRWVGTDARGRFVVGDRSDRTIKGYTADGDLVLTVGGTGQGPGEFSRLAANGVVGESIFGYDFTLGRLTLFDLDGPWGLMGRDASGHPLLMRYADDSTEASEIGRLVVEEGALSTEHERDR